MKTRTLVGILLVGFISINSIAQQTGLFTSSVSWTNNAGSQTRSIVVYVPTNYNANNEYSLVIGFHGQGDTPSNYIQNSKIMGFATNPYFGNVIIVCPEEGPQPAWFYGTEDFGILKAIKDQMIMTHNINSDEVFAQGFSFGGKSAFLHGLAEADDIKGIIAYSPAFYGDEDLNNACQSNNCTTAHQDFDYSNSNKVLVCTSAGQLYNGYGEGYMSPLAQVDQGGATWEDSFLGLAMVGADKINDTGGDAIFLESTNTGHSIAPLTISQQCWSHVNPEISTAGASDISSVKSELKIYPNPANNIVNISAPEKIESIALISITGKQVYLESNGLNTLKQIDLSDFDRGSYMLIVTTTETSYRKKIQIIKQ